MSRILVILTPHADDELVGCYSLIMNPEVTGVLLLMGSEEALMEIESKKDKLSNYFQKPFNASLYTKLNELEIVPEYVFLAPDMEFETHPLHRMLGGILRQLEYNYQLPCYYYSVNMQAPYIKEVDDCIGKQNALNTFYPHKSALWKYEHKYFLFEGFVCYSPIIL